MSSNLTYRPISKFSLLAVLAAAALTTLSAPAQAQTSINLANYVVTGNFTLATSVGGVSGLEASAVTYARDRGTLFFVGDEAKGVIEISRTGVALGSMAFTGFGQTTTSDPGNDAEGLTYLGNGVLVVTEERLQDAFRFTYTAGSSINFASPVAPFVSIGPLTGNTGIEGISVDSRNGNFITVKQDGSAELRIFNSLNFSSTPAADVTPDAISTGASSLFGLDSLSDVQTLGGIPAIAGEPAGDNLLVLSLDSRRLIEITRAGATLSSLDLTGITTQAIEGVTIDENGTIYLVAENAGGGQPNSRLFVLNSPTQVPEPSTFVTLLSGIGILAARRRRFTMQSNH